jgi:ABC-type Mn2+/Zn2+ transport system permease subunit
LPAVGVVLIAALLIMPGAAARFWTDRLDRMLILSCIFGLLIGVIGTAISATYAAMPAGPVIVLTGTSVFAMSALAGTRRGLIAQAIRHWRFRNDLLQRRLAPPELPADGRETSLAKTVSGAWTSIEFADAQSERPQNGRLEAAPVSALSAPPTSALASSAKIPPVSTGRPYVVLAIYLTVVALGALAWFMATIPAADYSLVVGTILTGVVTNASCAILGCYLVLRRMSLLGDAISHSVLPGIALAFVLTGQINGLPIIAGAMVLGIVTSVLSHSLHWFGKVSEDSSLGIVYTTLFAVGVILLQTFASGTHLDADCLIFGQIDTVGLDTVGLAGFTLPRAFVTQITVLAIVLGFVAALWKELKVVSFDPALAAAMGIRVLAVHYALMAMVAGVSVAAFESVGSVLVVAMLVIPAAAAHMMSDRLRHMLAWSVVIGGTSAVIGGRHDGFRRDVATGRCSHPVASTWPGEPVVSQLATGRANCSGGHHGSAIPG